MIRAAAARERGKALFHHRPAVAAALGLMAGIYLADGWSEAWLLGAGFCVLGALAHVFGYRRLVVFLLFMGLGMGRGLLAQPGDFPAKAQVTGRVMGETEVSRGLQVVLSRVRLDGERIPGRVLLILPDEFPAPAHGDWLAADGEILPHAVPEGGFDERTYDLGRGILCRAYGDGAEVFPGNPGPYGYLLRLKGRLEEILLSLYGSANGPLAVGMLLGDESHVGEGTLEEFRDSGIAHLLAVSGLHVGVLTSALLWLLRRRRAGVRLGITAGFLLLYCALTAFSASTLRASIMALSFLSAEALGRRNDSMSALALCAILILFVNPYQLFSAGFLLSFTAVYGILTLSQPLQAGVFRDWGTVGEGLSVSLAAQLGTLGPTAAFFGRLPVFSLLANMLVVPLAALALIPAFLAVPFYALLPPAGELAAGISGAVIALMRAVAAFAARPGVLLLPAPPLGACLFLLLGFGFFSRYCMAALKNRLALGGLCCALAAGLWILSVF